MLWQNISSQSAVLTFGKQNARIERISSHMLVYPFTVLAFRMNKQCNNIPLSIYWTISLQRIFSQSPIPLI